MTTIHTEAFDLAYKFVTETNVNIFLTGKAGTGKTTFLKYLKENPTKNMAVAAPTGVAAINAGGVTLHSMFQLPFLPFIPSNRETPLGINKKDLLSRMRYSSARLDLFHALELLVIDEASMVSAPMVDAIDTILRSVRHKQIPFGGVQVLFIGDLYQLQPVIKNEEWQLLKEYYSSIFFFDSHVLRDNAPVMIELKKIFRQKDQHFIEILNGIRENTLTDEHLRKLNQRLDPYFTPGDGDEYITLTTHNNHANRINEIKLNRLSSPPLKFVADIDGEFPDHMIPAEKELILKKDSQVMFIKNDGEEKKYFNGKIGVISEISKDEIVVLSDGIKIKVIKLEWENITYSVDPDTKQIAENVIGTFNQYPLRLAWAITIHKSQGLTFEKVVIDAENAFVNGQVYVALSRATSLEGLILTGPVNDRFLGAHSDLKNWQEKNYDENLLPKLFDDARQTFMKQQLFNAFTFDQFKYPMQSLKKEVSDNSTDPTVQKWLKEFSDKQISIYDTSEKFKETLHVIWKENHDVSKNEKLHERVKDAAVYFSSQLTEWKKLLTDHPVKVTTRKAARRIDKFLGDVNEGLLFSKAKIILCLNGFRFNELVAWKKSIPDSNEKIKSSYVSTAKEELRSGEHSELFDRIADFRKEIAREMDVPLFLVFSNQAIKNCCELLPGDKDSLLAVSGFGKKKVKEYGDEVIRIVREYCEEYDIGLNFLTENDRRKIDNKKSSLLSPTILQTIDLFKSGKNISEICLERKLTSSTIETHLATGIKNRILNIEQLMPKEEIESIASCFANNSLELKVARDKSGPEISYGKLRMVQAWLIAEKGIQ